MSDDAITRLEHAKTAATALRERGDLTQAVSSLRHAADVGRAALDGLRAREGSGAARLAWQLADCLGMLGGNLLRLGDPRAALVVFREGRDLESDPTYELDLTYNSVNVVVTRLLIDEAARHEDRADLPPTIDRLRRATRGTRASDPWAWADLGMCQYLQGDQAAAIEAYRQAAALADASSRQSMLQRLRMLRDRGVFTSDADAAGFEAIEGILA